MAGRQRQIIKSNSSDRQCADQNTLVADLKCQRTRGVSSYIADWTTASSKSVINAASLRSHTHVNASNMNHPNSNSQAAEDVSNADCNQCLPLLVREDAGVVRSKNTLDQQASNISIFPNEHRKGAHHNADLEVRPKPHSHSMQSVDAEGNLRGQIDVLNFKTSSYG